MRPLAHAGLVALLLAAVPARGAQPRDAAGDPAAGYLLDTTGTTSPVAKGAKGKLAITIRAQGAWHVDPRTPLRIDLAAPPAVRLEKIRLGKKDVVNPGDESPRLEAGFVAGEEGNHDVKARLDFFVCSAEACVKQVRELSLAISVVK